MPKQHCSQLRKILSIIDPERCLSSFFNKSLIRDKFLTDHVIYIYIYNRKNGHNFNRYP